MQQELKFSWSETEAVIDWLVRESSLCLDLPRSKATLTDLRSSQLAKYSQESHNYLAQLGLDNNHNSWHISNNIFSYSGHEISGLTDRQQKLLEVLLAKRGSTVSYDEIASVLWQNDQDFSLWAIVKEIARIRKCIKNSGVLTPVIHSHRKLGYSLI